nr:pentapeptide repeat-containing protein [Siculibacillus lacustris]
MTDGVFEKTTWDAVNFKAVTIEHAVFTGNRFSGVYFEDTLFRDVAIRDTVFSGGAPSGLRFEDSELAGVKFEKSRRLTLNLTNVRLRDVDFSGIPVSDDFRTTRFDHVRFDRSDLRDSDFRGVDLRSSSFAGAKLDGVTIDCATRFPDGFDRSKFRFEGVYTACGE